MIESAADGKQKNWAGAIKFSKTPCPSLSIGPSFFDHVCPLSSDNKHGWQRVCAGLGQCFMPESVELTMISVIVTGTSNEPVRLYGFQRSYGFPRQQKPPFDVVNRKLFLIPFHHVHPFSSQSLVYIEFNSSFHFHFDMFWFIYRLFVVALASFQSGWRRRRSSLSGGNASSGHSHRWKEARAMVSTASVVHHVLTIQGQASMRKGTMQVVQIIWQILSRYFLQSFLSNVQTYSFPDRSIAAAGVILVALQSRKRQRGYETSISLISFFLKIFF